jgi:hypothetical protein
MLKVCIPSLCQNEQRYALDVLLSEFLGLAFEVEEYEGEYIEITQLGSRSDSAKLTVDASFFYKAHLSWLKAESMPVLPLESWDPVEDGVSAILVEKKIPILYGNAGLVKNKEGYHLNLDIFGSAFFMLSRYEELVTPERDEHERFPASASIILKENFIERPIVDEYVEILWACISRLWPSQKRRKIKPQRFVSCDVDYPFDDTVESTPKFFRHLAGDLLKRRAPLSACRRIVRFICNKLGNYTFDENYTFEWYMNVCEKEGLRVAFYFIPTSVEEGNGCYELKDRKIIELLKKIDGCGHEIGVHGSYQTFRDLDKTVAQKKILDSALKLAGIKQVVRGNRQHYLRWDSAVTPELLDEAGFEYDSSGAFADHTGFRFGTAQEFSMWGWQSHKKLKLKQRPLVVMECSIILDKYMGLGARKEAYDYIHKLEQCTQHFGGNFTLLWHNSFLYEKKYKKLFVSILKGSFTE